MLNYVKISGSRTYFEKTSEKLVELIHEFYLVKGLFLLAS